jgi:hypothetical protein
MPNTPDNDSPDTEIPVKPRFGSKEWAMAGLYRKFEDTPDKPGYVLANATEYLKLRKFQRVLWPPKIRTTNFIWVDPPDWDQPEPAEDDAPST